MLEFSTDIQNIKKELICRNCKTAMLYHDKVEIFERDEDDEYGLHVVVEDYNVKVDRDIKNNPSTRRHGLTIYFHCQLCFERNVLKISQHKGCTELEMGVLKNKHAADI